MTKRIFISFLTLAACISCGPVSGVSVLKDASSSIYGMRGANGVILITTKH